MNRYTNKHKHVHKRKTKLHIIKNFLCYVVCITILTIICIPFTLLYGPFENAKKIYVGTAMNSMHYKWLATIFLSEDNIDKILGNNNDINNDSEDSSMSTEDSNLINIPKRKDNSIERKEISDENNKFKGYALIIKDPTRVRLGISSKLFEEGETVSEIASQYDAVAAINGGYFTDENNSERWSSNGGIPTGFLMKDGKILQNIDPNIESPILAITKDGNLLIGKTSVSKLLENEAVVDAMSYVTTLIKGGRLLSINDNEGSSPKTMLGQRTDGSIVFVVLDSNMPGGRICATLKEAQKVMNNLNCYNAINLDGGKSTTMYLNGGIINNPSNPLGERPISAGLIVK